MADAAPAQHLYVSILAVVRTSTAGGRPVQEPRLLPVGRPRHRGAGVDEAAGQRS